MDNDDRPIGKILSRREALALFTATGAAFLASCAGLPPTQAATSSPTSSLCTRCNDTLAHQLSDKHRGQRP